MERETRPSQTAATRSLRLGNENVLADFQTAPVHLWIGIFDRLHGDHDILLAITRDDLIEPIAVRDHVIKAILDGIRAARRRAGTISANNGTSAALIAGATFGRTSWRLDLP